MLLATGLALAAEAQTGSAEKQVRAIHDAYYQTLLTEGEDVALERYYDEDFTYLGVDGFIIDKAGLKARMRRNQLAHYTLKDELKRLDLYGDTAVISGHSVSTVSDRGQTRSNGEGYTEVWVKRAEGWKLVAEQITPQPQK